MQAGKQLLIVDPANGSSVDLGGMGVIFKVGGEQTRGELCTMEHPMEPGRLIPPHIHRHMDELSYVLEGTFGVRVGDEVGTAGPGSYFLKPRGVPHTFWNLGPGVARLIEIMWPAGFERFFETLAHLAATVTDPAELDAKREALARRHDTEFVLDWVPELKARYDLKLLGEP
jgi:quercetin dioxygenase-like cupin family protein